MQIVLELDSKKFLNFDFFSNISEKIIKYVFSGYLSTTFFICEIILSVPLLIIIIFLVLKRDPP